MVELVAYHQRKLVAASPPGHAFMLDLSGLRVLAITMLAAWDDDHCVAIGALKRLSDSNGEIKSMRTHPDHVRLGSP